VAERFHGVQVTADRALERLYRRHRVELYRWLLRETGDPEIAEDVLQTAFLQAYRALLTGEPPREPRSWLFAIARNANRGRFRRRRVLECELDEELPMLQDESLVWQLREALATLPVNQRAAIVLQEVAGLTYAEIAERLGVTAGAVQMLVFRARRRLRAELLGERRSARALVPLQPLLNALSRLSGAGDRALLLRGAAGLAGAVAIGGGVLATPGDASPPARSAPAGAGASAGSGSDLAVRELPATTSVPRAGRTLDGRRRSAPAAPQRALATAPSPEAPSPDAARPVGTGAGPSPPAVPTTITTTAPVRAPSVSEISTAPSTLTTTVSSTLSDATTVVTDTTAALTDPAPAAQLPLPDPSPPAPEVTVPQVTVPQVTAPPPPTVPLVTP
jgi:RNA polymerase sigma-70 factor (ECF subfamily)